jgi:hypothetical protein
MRKTALVVALGAVAITIVVLRVARHDEPVLEGHWRELRPPSYE